MSHDGEITQTKQGYQATFTRELRHPPERVWAMLTDSQRVGLWYVRTEIEPRVGGRVVEHHEHAGENAVSHGTVTRFDPPRLFEHTWWDDEYASQGIENVVRWELHPTAAGTRLVLIHRFPDLDAAAVMMAGWHSFLDVLADVLGGADPAKHAPARGEIREGTFVETAPGRGVWKDRVALEARYQERVRAATTPGASRPRA